MHRGGWWWGLWAGRAVAPNPPRSAGWMRALDDSHTSPALAAGLFLVVWSVLHNSFRAFCLIAPRRVREDVMLTSAECRARAEQKLAEADLHPRHEKRLRTAAEGWLNLADLMGRLEASVAEPAE